jgi:hypothetical protein
LAGCCEHGSESAGFIKGGEFCDHLSNSFPRRTLTIGVIVNQCLITLFNDFKETDVVQKLYPENRNETHFSVQLNALTLFL